MSNVSPIRVAQPHLGTEEAEAVVRVLQSGTLARGSEVDAFQQEFSELVEKRWSIAVNSGTSALQLALEALGVGPGDEVIVPALTFVGTANAVRLVGARPVFADIDPDTLCIDVDSIMASMGPRVRAVVPVHLYGHPARMDRIVRWASAHGVYVIEDAAQAHLSSLAGVPVGAWGDAAAFSFYATKNMTTGEGGMVCVKDEPMATLIRSLVNQGLDTSGVPVRVGHNLRMTEVQAAIGRVQLGRVHALTRRRQQNAEFLLTHLHGVVTPTVQDDASHVFHQFVIRVPEHDRAEFRDALRERGVESAVFYDVPLHRLAPHRTDVSLPRAEMAAAESLAIPVHPALSVDDLERVAAAVNDVASAGT